MYNNKALILAVGAALGIPSALAQKAEADSVVTLYGKVYPELVREYGKGATAAGAPVATFAAAPAGSSAIITRNEMESSNSRFGIRGSEKIGPTIRGIFQLETEFHLDNNDSRFAQRDSFVGLACDQFGTIKLGRMDTPFKNYADELSFLGVSSGNFTSTSAINRRPGFGGSNASRFHERAQNAVDYETPHIGGLRGRIQYSAGEADTSTRKPHFWSGGVKWGRGPIEISVGHEIHYDAFGLSRNVPASSMSNTNDQSVRSKDKATEIMLLFNLGAHKFEIDANQKKYDESASITGRARSYKNNSYLAIWDARWSQQWRTEVHYVKATAGSCSRVNATCVTDGLGGHQLSIGAAYYFSRRTYLFFMAQWLTNDSSAQFSSGSQTANVGEDVRQYAVGLQTTF